MRTARALALVVAAVAVAACDAPEAPPATDLQRADSLVRAWVEEGRVPGAVLHVSRVGAPVLVRAYGQARSHTFGGGQYAPGGATVPASAEGGIEPLAEPVPMTPGTVFDLASVTKVAATTMAVMLLVDRGALALDDPVQRHLPDFVGGGRERITVEHLLTHRSGLPQWHPVYYAAADADAAYAHIRSLPLVWPVGEGRHYSDLGFMLLGRIVERLAGEDLDAFLRRELYGPLGLEATGYRGARVAARAPSNAYAATSHGNPYERRMVHDPDFGYRIDLDPTSWDGWRRYTLEGEVNDGNAHYAFGGVAGHAGLFSTAAELDALLRLLLGWGELDGRRYLDSAVVARFLTGTGDDQALGWQVPSYAGGSAFAHTGFTGTFVLGDHATETALVLLTNRQHAGVDERTAYPDVGPLQRAVAAALLDPPEPASDGGAGPSPEARRESTTRAPAARIASATARE